MAEFIQWYSYPTSKPKKGCKCLVYCEGWCNGYKIADFVSLKFRVVDNYVKYWAYLPNIPKE